VCYKDNSVHHFVHWPSIPCGWQCDGLDWLIVWLIGWLHSYSYAVISIPHCQTLFEHHKFVKWLTIWETWCLCLEKFLFWNFWNLYCLGISLENEIRKSLFFIITRMLILQRWLLWFTRHDFFCAIVIAISEPISLWNLATLCGLV